MRILRIFETEKRRKSRLDAYWEDICVTQMRRCAARGCRCLDPFWCSLAIEERMAHARRHGLSESMAAIGGPFVIPPEVPGDALSVDRWLTRQMVDATIAGDE